ncbi:hypothetical protein SAMN04487965_0117 [Microbulbifer donghaiensis]|uniref:M61 glycyl aminopeptidase n=1 Tax=Microbulbifer donghaiensis TaxID=494016 RepID=A0A1M4UC81_9GAMM|nr:hypothetical protein [Microbulbifer donghaiensis]SHE54284.1 hypothetical protein SAMN04487965_0117 [Microbulbifer donghaiensis]
MLKRLSPFILPTLVYLCLAVTSPAALGKTYDLLYKATIDPASGMAAVEIQLNGQSIPKQLALNLGSGRYSEVTSDHLVELSKDKAIWRPEGSSSSLSYKFAINNRKGSGSYDSRITDDWAILRSDKLIPSMSVTGKGHSKAELQLELPEGWSSALPYPETGENHYRLKDSGRRFVRPKGWMIVGRIGARQDIITGVDTKIAGPLGEDIHRQDTLAFLNWNLPEIKKVFPKFPNYLLVVTAGDPMWRGGLSGTRSLFMHADRPLISGNRTSSMIHELVHVATGIRGDKQSDWIVEGLAEFYSLEILRRSGGISQRRYEEAMDKLADWGKEAPSLLVKRSSGPVTARAVGVMRALDQEIRQASGGKASIDDVARGLAEKRGEVTLERFNALAEAAAGRPVEALTTDKLRDESP